MQNMLRFDDRSNVANDVRGFGRSLINVGNAGDLRRLIRLGSLGKENRSNQE
jgi:hypothetical protein